MESYTYKQILLSLREEYLKNQKRLNALKKYIQLDQSKKYDEYDFYAFCDGQDKYIELALRERQSVIVKIIETLSNKIIGDGDKITTNIAHEYNGEKRYLTLPNSKIFSVNDLNSLMADADRILGTEFVQKVTSRIILDDKDYKLKISPSNIAVETGEGTIEYVPARFLYTPSSDQLSIMAYDDPLYLEHINNVFNTKISADLLSDYHRSIIDASTSKDKDISIQGVSMSKIPQLFDIVEQEDNSVLLKRVR